ncbi:hypothetical protein [Hymenobacter arizonensis]|uniref:Lipoprotein n=1 Tax=Hymenobacter arizonensis TaxID=1227077 RepID=A0A1I5ZSF5_HYMAR|nr:hypothetical protein [Hymenobacter arizonensis]SFQ59406.1 hypothetical protein SAMN04515668_3179 [Hymenobacter arizonensis]
MKPFYLVFGGAALLLAACNQTAPATEQPAAAPATTATTESAVPPLVNVDSAAAPADKVATAPAPVAPTLAQPEALKASFSFKPAPDPDDPSHPKTSVHLVLQGTKPMDIDLGKFAGRPDVVDAAKARQAGFPKDMLMGFRSYHAASGTSSDLAVLNVSGRRLRVVQRRVEETASEPGTFETSREIPLPAKTAVVASPNGQ